MTDKNSSFQLLVSGKLTNNEKAKCSMVEKGTKAPKIFQVTVTFFHGVNIYLPFLNLTYAAT
jgi:hypothetical protein